MINSVSVQHKWTLLTSDVSSAFSQRPHVYGLKDSPKAWRQKLDITLREAGGQPLHTDNALYVWFSDSKLAYMLSILVDDVIGTG